MVGNKLNIMQLINNVVIKKLIRHPDERGYFQEVIRSNDEFFGEGFGQLSVSHMHYGVVKAWHIHKTQIDWWLVVSGGIKAVLYDKRENSTTHKVLNEFLIGEGGELIVLKIPPGVAHGLKVMHGPADLVYVTSGIYNKDEEGRIDYQDKEIGYDWVQGIAITNSKVT